MGALNSAINFLKASGPFREEFMGSKLKRMEHILALVLILVI